MRLRSMMVLAAACAGLSGCATMVNPGKTRSAATPVSNGTQVKTARLHLKNTGPVLAVYAGNTPLEIRDEADHDDHVRLCRLFSENPLGDPPGMVTVSTNCMNSILAPYVELPKSGAHTLRLVRPDGEATVTVKTGTHWQWFWLNGVCLGLIPACWAVDIASGSWSYYGSLDVAHAVRAAGGSTVAASHE